MHLALARDHRHDDYLLPRQVISLRKARRCRIIKNSETISKNLERTGFSTSPSPALAAAAFFLDYAIGIGVLGAVA